MQVSRSERWWWYRLLRVVKRRLFSDSRASFLLSKWFRRVGYPFLVSWLYLPMSFSRKTASVPVINQTAWSELHESEVFDIQPTGLSEAGVSPPFPKLFCSVLNNACAFGGSNFLWADGSLLHHDLYAFETDYTSEENNLWLVFKPGFKRAVWMADIKPVSSLPEAAVFTDGCAGNYAHWLTEVLPRMAAFCADPRFKDVPLVVDQGLHVNIQASLRMVAGDHRQVHELALGQTMRVERLYWMSVAGYVPYERRTSLASGHAQGVFSPFALGLVREVGLRSAGATFNSGRAECGRKIFLKRNAHIRKIVNAQVLEAQLTARGFEVVEPEKLSFVEQVSLMSQADCIVGPTGAAFANLIFAPPDAQVVVLMGEHPDTSYDYWSNIAHAVGLKVTCLRGPSINDGKGIHSDFVIDVDALDRALRPH